jgi:hypothetical protein
MNCERIALHRDASDELLKPSAYVYRIDVDMIGVVIDLKQGPAAVTHYP